ncbi:MAG: DnaB-like helicase C-terminal domain-containing protein [Gallionella sp.]|nr:DnaB-like helicase C-terminal domain-containing protein [Gallionella sp.]
MNELDCLYQAISDIEEAYSNSSVIGQSEVGLGNILAYLNPVGLVVLTGGREKQNMMLASHIVHQRVFRLGVGCAVFCEDTKAFVTGQLSLVSEVGIKKLYAGEIGSEDWGCIVHAVDILEHSSLFLVELPSSLDLLMEAIRRYSEKCESEDRNSDYAVFVFDLPRPVEEQSSFAKMLHALKALSAEIDRPIIVIHDQCGQETLGELKTICSCADVFLTLEAMTDEQANYCNLSISIKEQPSSCSMRLQFGSDRFTVMLIENAKSDEH